GYRKQKQRTAFPKNLYRLLTAKDYPVYSTGILRRKTRRGSHWSVSGMSIFCMKGKNTVHGRLIWRTSGSRNRYHSEIWDRRADFPLYEVYIQEVLDGRRQRALESSFGFLKNF
ncbi:MAG: hypothetical protein V8S22_10600, partial [Lachnospiraceae bacterium]